jgi:hypothetical protein
VGTPSPNEGYTAGGPIQQYRHPYQQIFGSHPSHIQKKKSLSAGRHNPLIYMKNSKYSFIEKYAAVI